MEASSALAVARKAVEVAGLGSTVAWEQLDLRRIQDFKLVV